MSFALAAGGAAQAPAGDFYRHIGIGYSAGYHAPAPFVRSPTPATVHGWWHWKSACCHPGAPFAAGCGCGCDAPPPGCGTCGPAYSGRLPHWGGCGTSGPYGSGCSHNPGIY